MPTGIGMGIAGQVFGNPLSRDAIFPAEYCFEFDGVTELGFIVYGPDLGTKNFTVSVWFKTPDVTGGGAFQQIVGTQTFAGTQTYSIGLNALGKVEFTSNLTGWTDTFAAFTPVNNTWHNITYSVDRAGNAVWYGDLITTQSTNISANTTNLYASGSYFALAGGFSPTEKYEGLVADVKMWNIALTTPQVSQYYLNDKATDKKCSNRAFDTSDELIAWWRFSNPTGTYSATMPNEGYGLSGQGTTLNFALSNMAQANVITDYPT